MLQLIFCERPQQEHTARSQEVSLWGTSSPPSCHRRADTSISQSQLITQTATGKLLFFSRPFLVD